MKTENIAGKSVLITGGTKGIGFGIASVLLGQGCSVAITGRTQSGVSAAVEGLKAGSEAPVLGIMADVRVLEDMEKVVRTAVDHFGKLDVVIANAGLGHFGSIETITPEQWAETIDTNLTGVYNTLMPTVEPLKKSQGYFITIASLAGANFFAGGAAYNASKFGLVGFSQAVMLDLRPYGIKVTTIMPGSVASHFADHVPSSADAWKIQPEDIGILIADLLKMHPRTLPSKIEVRPSKPPGK